MDFKDFGFLLIRERLVKLNIVVNNKVVVLFNSI